VLPEELRGLAVDQMQSYYLAAFKEDHESISKNELQRRIGMLGVLGSWLGKNSRCKVVSEISTDVAWQFSCWLGQQGIATKTRNHKVATLRTAWKIFMRRGVANENPWTAARVQRNRDEEEHGRAFSDKEIGRLMAAARDLGCEWDGIITVALYTGMRKGDIDNLEWRSVDLEKRVIRVRPHKTSKHGIEVEIPMHEKVYRILSDAARNKVRGKWVFPWRQSHPTAKWKQPGDVFFSDVLKKAEIEERDGVLLSFHSLRHTFVTRLAEQGIDTTTRMKLAGHTSVDTHLIYTHDDVSARAAIDALE